MVNENNTIILGSYPQSSVVFQKKEPLEWIVLDKKEDRLFCVSKYLLDCKPYNEKLEKLTWKTCTLRKWLNNEFFYNAFTENEQKRILVTDVENPNYNTQDRIFLLSYDEAEKYFEFEERGAETTAYAREQGSWFLSEKEGAESDDRHINNGLWWLRYPDYVDEEDEWLYDGLSCVNFDGYIEVSADEVTAANCSVRPAIWIKL